MERKFEEEILYREELRDKIERFICDYYNADNLMNIQIYKNVIFANIYKISKSYSRKLTNYEINRLINIFYKLYNGSQISLEESLFLADMEDASINKDYGKRLVFDDEINRKKKAVFYELHAMGYNGYEEDEYTFMDLNDALTFSSRYDNSNFEPFNLTKIIYTSNDNGTLDKKEINMGKVPSKSYRNVNYYVLGELINDDILKVRNNYSYSDGLNEENLNSLNKDFSGSRDFYKVNVSLNDDNSISYDFKAIGKKNGKMRIRDQK